jgi:hypothetical protein
MRREEVTRFGPAMTVLVAMGAGFAMGVGVCVAWTLLFY